MATYEAYVTLGDGSVAISTVEIPLSVRSQTGDVAAPIAYLTLILPHGQELPLQGSQIRMVYGDQGCGEYTIPLKR